MPTTFATARDTKGCHTAPPIGTAAYRRHVLRQLPRLATTPSVWLTFVAVAVSVIGFLVVTP